MRRLDVFGPIVTQLRFRSLEAADVDIDGVRYHSGELDLGPASVDGWLADLAAAELGLPDVLAVDVGAGEILLDGRQVALTPLEIGVLSHLRAQRGKVVSRSAILRDVWGHDDVGGSNVVDSVIRSLRRKLGRNSASIETVRGFGYRCRL